MATELFANEAPHSHRPFALQAVAPGVAGARWADPLLGSGAAVYAGDSSRAACVMTDAERYTTLTEGMAPAKVVELLNAYFAALFPPVLEHGGRVVDVKGDGILAIWTDGSSAAEMRSRACEGCLGIARAVDRFNATHPEEGFMPTSSLMQKARK